MKHLFFAVLLLAGAALAQEDKFIAILKTEASPKEKADACLELARVGTRQAVPVLAPLLLDERFAHMARFALEPIPDPAVDAALRDALGRVKGGLLAGVISSLGARKDKEAIAPLARFLTDPDPMVAQTAARALGSIGGAAAAVLQSASGQPANQLAICEGLLRCAEGMSGAGATAIYDNLRKLPNLPHHLRVAALSGAVRSRGAAGLPLMIEAIRSESYVPAADAMRVSMALPGAAVTLALVGELAQANEEKQLLLLQTLAYRGDATAAPALAPLAQAGSANRRIVAMRSLVQLANPASLPVLAALARDPDPTVSSAALGGLSGLPGKAADAAVEALLNDSAARIRSAAIEAIGQRRITTALPALLKAARDADAGVGDASLKALGQLGGAAEIPSVVDAMFEAKSVTVAEAALLAICARQTEPAVCADKLLPGLAKAQGEAKLALLRVLGSVGDPKALGAVRAAAAEADESVRATALRALCDWPNAGALPDLAQIARTSPDAKIKVLALRGQLRLIPLQTVADAPKVAQLRELLPLLAQKEEQRLALAALGDLPSAESLALLVPFLTHEGLKEEASAAAVAVAEKLVATHPAEAADAMQKVQTGNSQLAGRARQVLARASVGATEGGFKPLFNGRDLSGWNGKSGWWTVEDGALTSESTPDKPCKECNYLIWSGGQPADFELLADFKLSAKANSGIQIRSEERPNWDTYGYQADMTGDGELIGFVYHHARGLIAGRGEKAAFAADGAKAVERIGDAAELLKHFTPGDWNTYRVICRGPEIALHLNGVLVCQITDHHATQAAARGIIALQMHPGPPMKVQFKNLRLRELR